jgi:hypothetical protein
MEIQLTLPSSDQGIISSTKISPFHSKSNLNFNSTSFPNILSGKGWPIVIFNFNRSIKYLNCKGISIDECKSECTCSIKCLTT